MNEWILIIAILTSNGWVEHEIKDWYQPVRVTVRDNFIDKSGSACVRMANSVSNNAFGRQYRFIKAYCKEQED